jgi:hypothetical protein
MLGYGALAPAREYNATITSENEACVANEPIESNTQVDNEHNSPPPQTAEDPRYEGATPPGYDWPTHGGYLGCLLGVMFACLLAPLGYIAVGFLGAFLAQPLGAVGVAIAVLVTIIGYLAIFIGLTRLGWRMGKRFLREYPQPVRPVWGEDDEEDGVVIVDADPPHVVDADQQPATGSNQPDGDDEAGAEREATAR